MRNLLLAIALLLVGPGAWAGPHLNAVGQNPFLHQREQIQAALKFLPKPAGDSDWYIMIAGEKEFFAALHSLERGLSAGTCYTVLEARMTYCNASWLGKAAPEQIAHSLAHEYGHLLCDCRVEERANAESQFLLHY